MRLDVFYDFSLRTMLFDYHSIQFRRMFRGAGAFSLTLNNLSEKNNLKEGAIIIAGSDAWLAENIHSYKNVKGEITLEVSGHHINALLGRRIVETLTINTIDTIEEQLYQLVRDHFIYPTMQARTVDNLSLAAAKSISKKATTAYTLEKMSVLEILNRVCGHSGLGYRLNYLPEQRQLVFEVLEGRNLAERVFFSEEYGNVAEAEIYQESEDYKNAGFKNGVWIGETSGLERREVFLNDDEDLADYARLVSVDGLILNTEQYIYQQDWDLGDTVSYLDKTLGFSTENPILEIQETHSKDINLEVIFGQRVPTIF